MFEEHLMNADEQEISALGTRRVEAIRAGGVDTVLALVTDDPVFLVPGEPPSGEAPFAAGTRAPASTSAPSSNRPSEIRELRITADWACPRTGLNLSVTFPDRRPAVARAGHALSIVGEKNNRSRLAPDANLLAPAGSPCTQS